MTQHHVASLLQSWMQTQTLWVPVLSSCCSNLLFRNSGSSFFFCLGKSKVCSGFSAVLPIYLINSAYSCQVPWTANSILGWHNMLVLINQWLQLAEANKGRGTWGVGRWHFLLELVSSFLLSEAQGWKRMWHLSLNSSGLRKRMKKLFKHEASKWPPKNTCIATFRLILHFVTLNEFHFLYQACWHFKFWILMATVNFS